MSVAVLLPLAGIPGKNILDCEKEAVLGLHADIEASGSAVNYGLASFDTTGMPTLFNGSAVTTDHDAQDGDIAREDNALSSGGGTNFAAGLVAANVSITASSASKKYVVFLSNGQGGGGSTFTAALADLKNSSTTIFSFAIGSRLSCTRGSTLLQKMANATGGKCQNVTNAADLSSVLTTLVMTRMVEDGLTVDGVVVGATTKTDAPPF